MSDNIGNLGNNFNQGFNRGYATGGRLSGIGTALAKYNADMQAQQAAQAQGAQETQLLGVKGLMSGETQVAQPGEQGSFSVPGLVDANGKPIGMKAGQKTVYQMGVDAQGNPTMTAVGDYSKGDKVVPSKPEKPAKDNTMRDFMLADKIDKQVNPSVAPTRSVLGIIGQTTVRAKRAIDQLNNPNIPITPQLLSGLGSDMAGILQGGAPTQIGMSEQQYNTLQSTIASGTQYLTQHPQDALPPEMKKQLVDSFNQLNDTGKQFIQNNIKSTMAVHKDWIQNNPQDWQDLVDSVNQDYGLSDSSKNTPANYKPIKGGQQSGQAGGGNKNDPLGIR